jgi:hypothetical protein
MCVLRGAKGLLLLALAQEGVTIDPNTLTASLTLPSTAKHPGSSSSSSSSSSGTGAGVGYSSANLSVPSPRIFRKAEAVRCLLQEELSDLLRDIIVPVSTTLFLSDAAAVCIYICVCVCVVFYSVCVCVSACVPLNFSLCLSLCVSLASILSDVTSTVI